MSRHLSTTAALGAALLIGSGGTAHAEEVEISPFCQQLEWNTGRVVERPVYSAREWVAQENAFRKAWARMFIADEPAPFVANHAQSIKEGVRLLATARQERTVYLARVGGLDALIGANPTASGPESAGDDLSLPAVVTTQDSAAAYVGERVSYANAADTARAFRQCPNFRG